MKNIHNFIKEIINKLNLNKIPMTEEKIIKDEKIYGTGFYEILPYGTKKHVPIEKVYPSCIICYFNPCGCGGKKK